MSTLPENIQQLRDLCEKETFELLKITEEDYNATADDSNEWSKKKTLSHLVNMASFLHQRIVRSQFEYSPEIIHDAEKWLKHSYFDVLNSRKLIVFWKNYNLIITDLISVMNDLELQKQCFLGVEESVSIQELVNDYVIEVASFLNKIKAEVLEVETELCF